MSFGANNTNNNPFGAQQSPFSSANPPNDPFGNPSAQPDPFNRAPQGPTFNDPFATQPTQPAFSSFPSAPHNPFQSEQPTHTSPSPRGFPSVPRSRITPRDPFAPSSAAPSSKGLSMQQSQPNTHNQSFLPQPSFTPADPFSRRDSAPPDPFSSAPPDPAAPTSSAPTNHHRNSRNQLFLKAVPVDLFSRTALEEHFGAALTRVTHVSLRGNTDHYSRRTAVISFENDVDAETALHAANVYRGSPLALSYFRSHTPAPERATAVTENDELVFTYVPRELFSDNAITNLFNSISSNGVRRVSIKERPFRDSVKRTAIISFIDVEHATTALKNLPLYNGLKLNVAFRQRPPHLTKQQPADARKAGPSDPFQYDSTGVPNTQSAFPNAKQEPDEYDEENPASQFGVQIEDADMSISDFNKGDIIHDFAPKREAAPRDPFATADDAFPSVGDEDMEHGAQTFRASHSAANYSEAGPSNAGASAAGPKTRGERRRKKRASEPSQRPSPADDFDGYDQDEAPPVAPKQSMESKLQEMEALRQKIKEKEELKRRIKEKEEEMKRRKEKRRATLEGAAPLSEAPRPTGNGNGKKHINRSKPERDNSDSDEHWRGVGEKVDIENATSFVGTCQSMCPDKEFEERGERMDVEVFERTNGEFDREKAVKKYRRSAAISEQPTPEDVRPPGVLLRTMEYLKRLCDSNAEFLAIHDFVRDRTRSLRQDFTLQGVKDDICIRIHEESVRFHILSEQRLFGLNSQRFVSKQNMEQLDKCLISLREMYDLRREKSLPTSPNEPEMQAYYILTQMSNLKTCVQVFSSFPSDVRHSKPVQFAQRAMKSASPDFGNAATFFNCVREAPYLAACLLHSRFIHIRCHALEVINSVHGTPVVRDSFEIPTLTNMLGFEDDDETINFCETIGFEVEDNYVPPSEEDDDQEYSQITQAASIRIPSKTFDLEKIQVWTQVRADKLIGSKVAEQSISSIIERNNFPASVGEPLSRGTAEKGQAGMPPALSSAASREAKPTSDSQAKSSVLSRLGPRPPPSPSKTPVVPAVEVVTPAISNKPVVSLFQQPPVMSGDGAPPVVPQFPAPGTNAFSHSDKHSIGTPPQTIGFNFNPVPLSTQAGSSNLGVSVPAAPVPIHVPHEQELPTRDHRSMTQRVSEQPTKQTVFGESTLKQSGYVPPLNVFQSPEPSSSILRKNNSPLPATSEPISSYFPGNPVPGPLKATVVPTERQVADVHQAFAQPASLATARADTKAVTENFGQPAKFFNIPAPTSPGVPALETGAEVEGAQANADLLLPSENDVAWDQGSKQGSPHRPRTGFDGNAETSDEEYRRLMKDPKIIEIREFNLIRSAASRCKDNFQEDLFRAEPFRDKIANMNPVTSQSTQADFDKASLILQSIMNFGRKASELKQKALQLDCDRKWVGVEISAETDSFLEPFIERGNDLWNELWVWMMQVEQLMPHVALQAVTVPAGGHSRRVVMTSMRGDERPALFKKEVSPRIMKGLELCQRRLLSCMKDVAKVMVTEDIVKYQLAIVNISNGGTMAANRWAQAMLCGSSKRTHGPLKTIDVIGRNTHHLSVFNVAPGKHTPATADVVIATLDSCGDEEEVRSALTRLAQAIEGSQSTRKLAELAPPAVIVLQYMMRTRNGRKCNKVDNKLVQGLCELGLATSTQVLVMEHDEAVVRELSDGMVFGLLDRNAKVAPVRKVVGLRQMLMDAACMAWQETVTKCRASDNMGTVCEKIIDEVNESWSKVGGRLMNEEKRWPVEMFAARNALCTMKNAVVNLHLPRPDKINARTSREYIERLGEQVNMKSKIPEEKEDGEHMLIQFARCLHELLWGVIESGLGSIANAEVVLNVEMGDKVRSRKLLETQQAFLKLDKRKLGPRQEPSGGRGVKRDGKERWDEETEIERNNGKRVRVNREKSYGSEGIYEALVLETEAYAKVLKQSDDIAQMVYAIERENRRKRCSM